MKMSSSSYFYFQQFYNIPFPFISFSLIFVHFICSFFFFIFFVFYFFFSSSFSFPDRFYSVSYHTKENKNKIFCCPLQPTVQFSDPCHFHCCFGRVTFNSKKCYSRNEEKSFVFATARFTFFFFFESRLILIVCVCDNFFFLFFALLLLLLYLLSISLKCDVMCDNLFNFFSSFHCEIDINLKKNKRNTWHTFNFHSI